MLAAVSDAILGAGVEWRALVVAPLAAIGQLLAIAALIRSLAERRSGAPPAWDCAAVLAAALVPSLLARLYLATLSVDVHLTDTYFVLGDFHLVALLGPAIGGPLALRYFAPQRYASAPVWLRRAAPWLIGAALIGYGVSLLRLGHAGMPRRYYAYLPELLPLHRSAAVAATLLGLGMLVELGPWLGGRPRRRSALSPSRRAPS